MAYVQELGLDGLRVGTVLVQVALQRRAVCLIVAVGAEDTGAR